MFKSDKHLAEPSGSVRDNSPEKELVTRYVDYKSLNTVKVAIDTTSSNLSELNRDLSSSSLRRPLGFLSSINRQFFKNHNRVSTFFSLSFTY
jgi:hypothetical protein